MSALFIKELLRWVLFTVVSIYITYRLRLSTATRGRKWIYMLLAAIGVTAMFGIRLGAVFLVLAPIAIVTIPGIAAGQTVNRDDLSGSHAWAALPKAYSDTIAARFSSRVAAQNFVMFCERSDSLMQSIKAASTTDVDSAAVATAIGVTAYGYRMAKAGSFTEARQAWDYALILRPRHSPAWAGLAVLSFKEGNCSDATKWAEMVISYVPSKDSDDPEERFAAEVSSEDRAIMDREMEKRGLVPSSRSDMELKEQMTDIVRSCRETQ